MNARARIVGRDVIVKGPGFTITIRPDTVPPPADDGAPITPAPASPLVPFPFGLESKAAAALIKSGRLPATREGRRWYTTRAALEALVTPAAPPPPADDEEDLARMRARLCSTRKT